MALIVRVWPADTDRYAVYTSYQRAAEAVSREKAVEGEDSPDPASLVADIRRAAHWREEAAHGTFWFSAGGACDDVKLFVSHALERHRLVWMIRKAELPDVPLETLQKMASALGVL